MNFRGHLVGGLVSSGIVVSGIHLLYKNNDVSPEPNYLILGTITLGMSLFPDLDIQSTPQKWFYRSMFIFLGILVVLGKYKEAAFFGWLSLIPILDHHRGITHMWSLSIVIPVLVCFCVYYCTKIESDPVIVSKFLKDYHWFFIVASVGWMTHLILDLPFFRRIS